MRLIAYSEVHHLIKGAIKDGAVDSRLRVLTLRFDVERCLVPPVPQLQ